MTKMWEVNDQNVRKVNDQTSFPASYLMSDQSHFNVAFGRNNTLYQPRVAVTTTACPAIQSL